ncbi:hypothetical protein CROQUDRAFT_399578 [Cronartium quercuum f. sp. fusiforme G11]|uniref:Uncharacterized protein n=1 Tax=Cronartium quercuum f. sp. fusiforme G11 TaxID=708437 RepID=A0A9P6N5U0_9BASI|nr:hypothetical protein CROQUDRAFT_399578 [Cronartium quercuum f. sp. fusiforme G11]
MNCQSYSNKNIEQAQTTNHEPDKTELKCSSPISDERQPTSILSRTLSESNTQVQSQSHIGNKTTFVKTQTSPTSVSPAGLFITDLPQIVNKSIKAWKTDKRKATPYPKLEADDYDFDW